MTGFANLAQPGILAAPPAMARYLTFSLASGAARGVIGEVLQRLADLADGERMVVGLGHDTVAALGRMVPGLAPFSAPAGSRVPLPATGGALWVWLRGDDRGELLTASWQIEDAMRPAFALAEAVDAFLGKLFL